MTTPDTDALGRELTAEYGVPVEVHYLPENRSLLTVVTGAAGGRRWFTSGLTPAYTGTEQDRASLLTQLKYQTEKALGR